MGRVGIALVSAAEKAIHRKGAFGTPRRASTRSHPVPLRPIMRAIAFHQVRIVTIANATYMANVPK